MCVVCFQYMGRFSLALGDFATNHVQVIGLFKLKLIMVGEPEVHVKHIYNLCFRVPKVDEAMCLV